MHILFLAVAAVLIIMWFHGGLFACVFLSIVPAGFLFLCVAELLLSGNLDHANTLGALACAALLGGIWARGIGAGTVPFRYLYPARNHPLGPSS